MKTLIKKALFIVILALVLSWQIVAQGVTIKPEGMWDGVSMLDFAVEGSYAYCLYESDGLVILDISDPFSPVKVSTTSIADCLNLQVSGNYLYLTIGSYPNTSLHIIDVSDPKSPKEVSTYARDGHYISAVAIQGNYAYVGSSYVKNGWLEGDITILDISTPASPQVMGTVNPYYAIDDLVVRGNYVYTASYRGSMGRVGKLNIFDVSDPANPLEVGIASMPGRAYGVSVSGNYAYIADGDEGLQIIDVSVPSTPVIVGNYKTGDDWCVTVLAKNFYAYIGNGGFTVVNVTDKANPVLVKESSDYGTPRRIKLTGSFAYTFNSQQGFQILDVGDSEGLHLVGRYDPYPTYPGRVLVDGNYAYVGDSDGLHVLDISNVNNPIWVAAAYLNGSTWVRNIKRKDNRIYLLTDKSLNVISISNPLNPANVSSIPQDSGATMEIKGDYLYISRYVYPLQYHLLVYDISAKTTPVLVNTITRNSYGHDLSVSGDYLYLSCKTGLEIYDISNPASPSFVHSFEQVGSIDSIIISGSRLYASYGTYPSTGLAVLDISTVTSPVVLSKQPDYAAGNLTISGGYLYGSTSVASLTVFDLFNADIPRAIGSYSSGESLMDFAVQGSNIYIVDDDQRNFVSLSTSFHSHIQLDTTPLKFFVVTPETTAPAQTLIIRNSGIGQMQWTVSPVTTQSSWLICTPPQGINGGTLSVSIDASGLAPGVYTGSLVFSADGTDNSPSSISVTLTVYDANSLAEPFGEFATPSHDATVSSSIAVTGWALDDLGVTSVKIFRETGNSLAYIGDAMLVEGARPDVQAAYPGYPNNSKAGWGYMLLTNFLPGGGNGTFTLHAIATDVEGNQVTLGTKTIHCDNANAVKPFGAIDTPAQGGMASGSQYINWGWALTPSPKTIPMDGSTIDVWVDGVKMGNPTYNIYREDIATLFPGYSNSGGAVGYFYLDTTKLSNGVHTIQWTVWDDAWETDGVGSRYFTVQNNSPRTRSAAAGKECRDEKINTGPVEVKSGFAKDAPFKKVKPDEQGNLYVEMEALGRLEIRLEPGTRNITPLPVGAHLNMETGVLTFAPGVAYLGLHQMVFTAGRSLTVNILPMK